MNKIILRGINAVKQPWVLWINYGYEGWKPYGFDTLKAALQEQKYGIEWVITPGAQDYDVLVVPTPHKE